MFFLSNMRDRLTPDFIVELLREIDLGLVDTVYSAVSNMNCALGTVFRVAHRCERHFAQDDLAHELMRRPDQRIIVSLNDRLVGTTGERARALRRLVVLALGAELGNQTWFLLRMQRAVFELTGIGDVTGIGMMTQSQLLFFATMLERIYEEENTLGYRLWCKIERAEKATVAEPLWAELEAAERAAEAKAELEHDPCRVAMAVP